MSSPKKKAQKKPLPPEEARLGPLVREGNIEARNELILTHLSTVETVIQKVFAPIMSRARFVQLHDDFLSVGTLALFSATKSWDYRDGPFFQYAWTAIENDVRNYLHRDEAIPRKRSQTDDPEMNPRIPVKSLHEVVQNGKKDRDRDILLIDTLGDRFGVTPEQYAELMDELALSRKRIQDLLIALNQREISKRNRNIFLSFWRLDKPGRDWGVKWALNPFGRMFGISGTRVDQILNLVQEKISSTYTRKDLERDIATIHAYRETVMC